MLRFDRKQQNSVKQLSFNKKIKRKKKEKNGYIAINPSTLAYFMNTVQR